MSLHFFHAELAFIGVGVPISPTDGQVQEGAGLQVNQVLTHRLGRRNHSTHLSASSTHLFPQNTQAGASATGNLVPSVSDGAVRAHRGAGAAESPSGTRGLGFGVGLVLEHQFP